MMNKFAPAEWEKHHTPRQLCDALARTISTIIAIQQEVLSLEAKPNSLNIAITDGKSLIACRYRNHAMEQPPSLYYSTTAGITLNRQFPDQPDGANGSKRSRKVESANRTKAVEILEGHNPFATRDAREHGIHFIVASEPTTYKVAECE